jgi:hypothetical protein
MRSDYCIVFRFWIGTNSVLKKRQLIDFYPPASSLLQAALHAIPSYSRQKGTLHR